MKSPKLVDLTLDLADYAFGPIRRGKELELINAIDGAKVQKAINLCDAALAEEVLVEAGLPKALMARVKKDRGELDMYSEWGLA